MRDSVTPNSTDRWLFYATFGLGLCLACTEYERYTALWNFGTRSLGELAFIMLSLCATLAIAVALTQQNSTQRKTVRLYASKPLILCLALIQTLGLTERVLQTTGIALPEWAVIVGPVLMQSAGILFVLYAQFFLDIGVRKSVRAFACALLIAGGTQLLCAWLPSALAFGALFLFAPASCWLLIVAQCKQSTSNALAEQEDIAAERENTRIYSRAFPFWQCCVSIAFINVLLLALHDQAMTLQDGGELSLTLQISSGLGSMLAGALFLSILNYLQELEFVELFRTLVLPLVLVALHASSLFGAGAPVFYLVPLGVGYSILLLLIWTMPRNYPNSLPFTLTCIAFFVYKIGWAAGIVGIMIAPVQLGDIAKTVVIFTAFLVLICLAAAHLVRYLRSFTIALKQDKREPTPASGDEALLRACEIVAKTYGLTPREQEVLPLLARGRNANHIASTLVISNGTARTHIMHIYQKMEINSQQALMDCVEEEMRRG